MQASYPNPRADTAISKEKAGHDTLFLVHIPGNAGGSIRKALGQYGGNHRAYHHQKASKLCQAFQSARKKQLFCVIRNPIDRALKSWSWCSRQSTWHPLVSSEQAQVYSALFASSDPSTFFERVNLASLATVCHHFTKQADYLDVTQHVEMISFDSLQAGLERLVATYGGRPVVLPTKKMHETDRPSADSLSKLAVSNILDFYNDDNALWQNVRLI